MDYLNLDELFRNAEPTTINRDVKRQIYVENLLSIYSPKYVAEQFGISEGEIRAASERCDPVAERLNEVQNAMGVSELMSKIVGVEG